MKNQVERAFREACSEADIYVTDVTVGDQMESDDGHFYHCKGHQAGVTVEGTVHPRSEEDFLVCIVRAGDISLYSPHEVTVRKNDAVLPGIFETVEEWNDAFPEDYSSRHPDSLIRGFGY